MKQLASEQCTARYIDRKSTIVLSTPYPDHDPDTYYDNDSVTNQESEPLPEHGVLNLVLERVLNFEI